jgi:hypothetical protein
MSCLLFLGTILGEGYPAPTNTPVLTCDGKYQSEPCSQTAQCDGCLPASYTCQGYIPGVKCGTCYCTSTTVTPANCGPWGNCSYDPSNGWCETRFCDFNGSAVSSFLIANLTGLFGAFPVGDHARTFFSSGAYSRRPVRFLGGCNTFPRTTQVVRLYARIAPSRPS